MRPAAIVVAVSALLVLLPTLAAQSTPPTNNGPTSAPIAVTGDAQALAVVQAALTALGGQNGISSLRTWTVQASMQGSQSGSNINYSIGWDSPPGMETVTVGGRTRTRRARMIRSYFVPVMVGSILLKELQDSHFSIRYGGPVSLGSVSTEAVILSVKTSPLSEQVWLFDATTHLPDRVDFRLPAVIGSVMSFEGPVDLGDYRSIDGVLHPFSIKTRVPWNLPVVITLTSLVPSATSTTNTAHAEAGDRQ